MSEEATGVQPTEVPAAPEGAADPAVGQGETEVTTSGLYSLDAVPESIRGEVEPLFKEWDANVTKEFQKRAEQLKAFEPYEGLLDIPADDFGHLKAFYEIATDEDAFKQWVQEAASSLGLLEAAAPAVEGEGAPEGAGEMLTRQQVEEMMAERERARAEEEAQQEAVEQIARTVRETLDDLKGSFEGDPKLWDEELITFLAQRHQKDGTSVEDVLKAGFADFQRMLNASASGALDEKVNQPKPTAVTGGNANSAPTPATSFDEAAARTLERLRAANAQ